MNKLFSQQFLSCKNYSIRRNECYYCDDFETFFVLSHGSMETYIDTNVILVHINLVSIYNKNSFQITQVPSTCESNLKYMFFNLNFLSNNIFFFVFPSQ